MSVRPIPVNTPVHSAIPDQNTTGLLGNSVYGTCHKCSTPDSLLWEFSAGYWICKSNYCYDEDVEHESQIQVKNQEDLESYQRLIRATGG